MSKRLAMLEKMTANGAGDSFARYALALEYKSLDRIEDALSAFKLLRESDATYVPMYLMCGSMLIDAGRTDDGKEWLTEGVTRAREKGDDHALSELEAALEAAGG